MEWQGGIESSVSGALGIVLLVSRVTGVAPLHFTKLKNGWRVRLSATMRVYSYIMILILNFICVTACVMDLSVDQSKSVRMRSPVKKAVWIADVLIIAVISTFGAHTAPDTMQKTMRLLNTMYQINSKLNSTGKTKLTERKQRAIIAICILGRFTLNASDFCNHLRETILHERDVLVCCLYLSYYIETFVVLSLELKFMFIILTLHSTLAAVNDDLKNLVQAMDLHDRVNKRNIMDASQLSNGANTNNKIKFITVMNPETIPPYQGYPVFKSQTPQEIVHRLSHTYGIICDVVRQIDQSHGVVLLMILLAFLLHLVVTPYNLISSLNRSSNLFEPPLQFFWCVLHTLSMIVVVEPCHQTQEEMNKTRVLVSQLSYRAETHSVFSAELDKFFQQLMLNNATFSPLGMCTLSRPLIASIFGGVTTYLVIIIQFQSLSDRNS